MVIKSKEPTLTQTTPYPHTGEPWKLRACHFNALTACELAQLMFNAPNFYNSACSWISGQRTATECLGWGCCDYPTNWGCREHPTNCAKKALALVDHNVKSNGLCPFCRLLCICTIPMMVVVFVAFLIASVVSWHLNTVQLQLLISVCMRPCVCMCVHVSVCVHVCASLAIITLKL